MLRKQQANSISFAVKSDSESSASRLSKYEEEDILSLQDDEIISFDELDENAMEETEAIMIENQKDENIAEQEEEDLESSSDNEDIAYTETSFLNKISLHRVKNSEKDFLLQYYNYCNNYTYLETDYASSCYILPATPSTATPSNNQSKLSSVSSVYNNVNNYKPSQAKKLLKKFRKKEAANSQPELKDEEYNQYNIEEEVPFLNQILDFLESKESNFPSLEETKHMFSVWNPSPRQKSIEKHPQQQLLQDATQPSSPIPNGNNSILSNADDDIQDKDDKKLVKNKGKKVKKDKNSKDIREVLRMHRLQFEKKRQELIIKEELERRTQMQKLKENSKIPVKKKPTSAAPKTLEPTMNEDNSPTQEQPASSIPSLVPYQHLQQQNLPRFVSTITKFVDEGPKYGEGDNLGPIEQQVLVGNTVRPKTSTITKMQRANTPHNREISSVSNNRKSTQRNHSRQHDEVRPLLPEEIVKMEQQLNALDTASNKKDEKAAMLAILMLLNNVELFGEMVSSTSLLTFMKKRLDLESNCMTFHQLEVHQLFICKILLKLLTADEETVYKVLSFEFAEICIDFFYQLIQSLRSKVDEAKMNESLVTKTKLKLVIEIMQVVEVLLKKELSHPKRDFKVILLEKHVLCLCVILHCFSHAEVLKETLRSVFSMYYTVEEVYALKTVDLSALLIKGNFIDALLKILKIQDYDDHAFECLKLIHMISRKSDVIRDQLFEKEIYHTLVFFLRSPSEKIKKIALLTLSYFLNYSRAKESSKSVTMDEILLKYGLEPLVQIFCDEDSNEDLKSETCIILSHLSSHSQCHSYLIHTGVLKCVFGFCHGKVQLSDDPNSSQNSILFNSTVFAALLILSNLTKSYSGIYEIIRVGGCNIIFKSLKLVLLIIAQQATGEKAKLFESITAQIMRLFHQEYSASAIVVEFSDSELGMLPKMVTKTIANLSNFVDGNGRVITEEVIDELIVLLQHCSDRTCTWNILCTISNVAQDFSYHKKLLKKSDLRSCLQKFFKQKDDLKLLNRVVKTISMLSKNSQILYEIVDLFPIHSIVSVALEVDSKDIQLECIRCIANMAKSVEFHSLIITAGAVELLYKMYVSNPQFHSELQKCVQNLSSSTKCREKLQLYGLLK